MSFYKLIDILSEELTNRQRQELDRLYATWQTQMVGLSYEVAERIYTKHREVFQNIRAGIPSVERFLLKYDGRNNNPKYTVDDLRNVNQPKVNVNHLVEFLENFISERLINREDNNRNLTAERLRVKQVFETDGRNSNKEKIEESKKMWYSTEGTIINENGVRVYPIMNQQQAIRMGYYYIHKHAINCTQLGVSSTSWCVTHRGNDIVEYKIDEEGNRINTPSPILYRHYANLYNSYRKNRTDNYTFYFIINETKPITDENYFGAIIVNRSGNFLYSDQYQYGGERYITWEQLKNYHPQIENYKNLFVFREEDIEQDDEQITTIVDIITETNRNSPNYYGRQSPDRQRQFIESGGILTQATSWVTTEHNEKLIYIGMTLKESLFSRFSNLEFLEEVLKTNTYKTLLHDKIKNLGYPDGLAYLYNEILKTKYGVWRRNVRNKKQIVLVHKETKKMGIFDLENAKWLKLDGIEYLPTYTAPRKTTYNGSDGKRYLVETYIKTTENDPSTFYTIKEIAVNNALSYFLSKKGMDKLIADGKLISNRYRLQNFDTENDFDLKESYFKRL